MLSGRLPFTSDTPSRMLFQHAYEAPRPLREAAPEVPGGLAVVVERMLAKDVARRYSSRPAEVPGPVAAAPATPPGPGAGGAAAPGQPEKPPEVKVPPLMVPVELVAGPIVEKAAGRQLTLCTGHEKTVAAVAVSPGGRYL